MASIQNRSDKMQDYPVNKSATTFTTFGNLPSEIRILIWRSSAPGPRVVAVGFHRHTAHYRSRISPPGILSANNESRNEGLKIYRELRLGPTHKVVGCYVDFTRDTVYLRSGLTTETDRVPRRRIVPPLMLENTNSHDDSGRYWHPLIESNFAASTEPVIPPDRKIHGIDGRRNTFYSDFIFEDLMQSPDAEDILRDLYVDLGTWTPIWRLFQNQRHNYPNHAKKFTIILERGIKPLHDIRSTLQDVVLPPWPHGFTGDISASCPNWPLFRMIEDYLDLSKHWNRSDNRKGLPEVLTLDIALKILQRGHI